MSCQVVPIKYIKFNIFISAQRRRLYDILVSSSSHMDEICKYDI